MWVMERLIIRLASEASQKQYWLIWSEDEQEIIASGEIDNAEQLHSLTEKALSRQVICLLPGMDVCIKEVPIKGAFNRQMQQALPYLMEEDLAVDVEKLHFTVIEKQTDLVHVAVCNKQRMNHWLAWLSEAKISCKQFIPEGLTLPFPADKNWQAVQLDNHWIVRESKELAWSCEHSMLDIILASKITEDKKQTIESYSPLLQERRGDWVSDLPILPMELLARGIVGCKINLLNGEFKVKKEVNKALMKWRLPAIVVSLIFMTSCFNLYFESRKIEAQVSSVKEQVESAYRVAFPAQKKLRYSRIKKKLKSMLAEANAPGGNVGFLIMLDELVPAFDNNKQLVPSNLKYDAKKQEMRILAIGKNFQTFEKFAAALPEGYRLQQGALNSSKDRVSGLLTIRKR